MKLPPLLDKSGVYKISCVNGLFYIGSSWQLRGRFSEHLSGLKRGIHPNVHLQHAWNKYGSEGFTFEVLEYCSKDQTFEREQYYLDTLRPYIKTIGFNRVYIAGNGGWRGQHHSDETKEKLRQKQTGRVKSPEEVEKLKAAWIEHRDAWEQQAINSRGVSFEIVSPSGETFRIRGLKRFAKEHNLDRSQLSRVIKGTKISVCGWHLPQTVLPPPYRLQDPNGTIHVVKYGTLKSFCRERGLRVAYLNLVAIGKGKSSQGWTRAED